MTLPETNPPPPATPVIGYAGAEAVQLNLRALARIRLGIGFLIATMAGSLLWLISPYIAYFTLALIAAGFALCLAVASCLLAANTRLPSDRPLLHRLLLALAVALVVTTAVSTVAMYLIFGDGRPNVSKIWLNNLVYPFNATVYGTTLCLCFLRIAYLARGFSARAIAVQCTIAAVTYLALHALSLSAGFLVRFAGVGPLQALSLFVRYFSPVLSLWAIIFLAFLLPRLKPIPA